MCVMEAATLTGGVRQIRDNVNAVTGWGNPGTRGEQSSPTVNVYTHKPGGDIQKAPSAGASKDSLKVSSGGKN